MSAHMADSKSELREFIRRLSDLGVDDLYVIAGDGEGRAGPYWDVHEVLCYIQDMEHTFIRFGVACYPEGRPHIGGDALIDAPA